MTPIEQTINALSQMSVTQLKDKYLEVFGEPARTGNRTFLTYSTTARGNEAANASMGLLDMTPYGRGEAWEDNPDGWPEGQHSCWSWCADANGNATWGPTSRPVPQWTRPGATPVTTLGRRGDDQ